MMPFTDLGPRLSMQKTTIAILTAATVLVSGCASALWSPWIGKQTAEKSASPREARLVPLRMVKPPSGTPQSIARWWGYWHGWFGYGKEFDMKIVIARIDGNDATVQYSWATASGQNVSILPAQISGNEINMKLPVGGYLSMRLRENGNEMEVVQRTGYSGVAVEYYGLLVRQPDPTNEYLVSPP